MPDRGYRAWEGGLFERLTSEWQLEELYRASHYPKLRKYIKPHEADLAPGPDDNPLLAIVQ